jgi:hypothetical protein
MFRRNYLKRIVAALALNTPFAGDAVNEKQGKNKTGP